jgi:hypothetical protein
VGGVVRDVLSGNLLWIPARDWRVVFSAVYQIRDQPTTSFVTQRVLAPTTVGGIPDVAEQVGFRVLAEERDFRAVSYYAGILVKRYLDRRSWIFVNVNWSRSELKREFQDTVPSDRFRIGVGFVYMFPNFHVPL